VRVLEPGNEYNGISEGINERGELLVRREDGTLEAVYAGEVSVRGVYGYV
jgi:BirA family biotin operon repressor/biotin-[acetyl-CoA-carboxylase] ligase